MNKNVKYIVGVDEVGRGPIAGPVAVCAFVVSKDSLGPAFTLTKAGPRGEKFRDSKKLSVKRREEIVNEINKELSGKKIKKEKNDSEELRYKVSFVGNKTIDKIGIVKSLELAITECLKGLDPDSCEVLLDGGLKAPNEFKNQKTIIKGDESEFVISLASIIAKVSRDEKMRNYSRNCECNYDKYGFESHKGYGTKKHFQAIDRFGLCDLHRKTFLKKI